jgi:hypothetical protein
MEIAAHCSASVDASLEREAVEAAFDALAPLFEFDAARERSALFVVSSNAGSATSMRFWADAVRTGVALASPEHFPWCLANAPCGALARRFGITGPNFTCVGEAEALAGALQAAADELATARVDVALVVAFEFADTVHARADLLGLRLDGAASSGGLRLAPVELESAGLSLRAAIRALAESLRERSPG